MTKTAIMASNSNSSPVFTPATTPEESAAEPAKFIESMPSFNAGKLLIRDWLYMWFIEHKLSSTVCLCCIDMVYWNGLDIRALDTRTMFRELDSWKLKEIYIPTIMRDIVRAREFEVGHHHVQKKRQG
jgi:hypothetical protein